MPVRKDTPQSELENLRAQVQMFTLRIWIISQENAALEWRGRIQHIQSGEVQYCQNWEAFIAYVEEILRNPTDI